MSLTVALHVNTNMFNIARTEDGYQAIYLKWRIRLD